jgi:hypothetical protein
MINTWQAYLMENEGRYPLSKSAINTLITPSWYDSNTALRLYFLYKWYRLF